MSVSGSNEPIDRGASSRKEPGHGGRWFAAVAVAAVMLLAIVHPAQAKYASFVVEMETGRVLHSVNADTRNYPASLTKMMTLLMVFEALDRGDVKLDHRIRFSPRAAAQPPSKLGLGAGETLTVEQAILALVTRSANDVATAVAEHLAGTESDFALRMTQRARALGMSNTTFRNASGLPNKGQLSTARDMARLASILLTRHARHYDYFSTRDFTFRGVTHRNHNELLKTYDGADGIKTGYIRASGFNLVASAKRDGRRIIGVVFGGESARHRNSHMVSLLDSSFEKLVQYAAAKAPTVQTKAQAKAQTQPRPTEPRPALAEAERKKDRSWSIQVGAYHREQQAEAVARSVVEKAPDHLAFGSVAVVPIKNGKRTLYRSRIVDLTRAEAQRACAVLRARAHDCLEMRTPEGLRVAANATEQGSR